MSQGNVEIVRAVYERWSEGDFRVAAYTRSLLEPWTHFTIEAEEIVGAGDTVLAAVRQRGVESSSGVPTVLRYITLWTFRGRKVIHLESFRERAEALEAVGLTE
jgi:ketosteroid isomerase-like protein